MWSSPRLRSGAYKLHLSRSCVRGRHSSELVLRQRAVRGRNATAASRGPSGRRAQAVRGVGRKRARTGCSEVSPEREGGEWTRHRVGREDLGETLYALGLFYFTNGQTEVWNGEGMNPPRPSLGRSHSPFSPAPVPSGPSSLLRHTRSMLILCSFASLHDSGKLQRGSVPEVTSFVQL